MNFLPKPVAAVPIEGKEALELRQFLAGIPNAPLAAEFFGRNVVDILRFAWENGAPLESALPPEPAKPPRRNGPLPPEIHAAILAALHENPNASQVANQIGEVSVTTVASIAHAAGIELTSRGGPAPMTDEMRATIVAALRKYRYAKSVGDMLGFSSPTISKIGAAAGLYLPVAGEIFLTGKKRERVLASLRETPNVRLVAARHRLADMTVRGLAVEEGIKSTDRAPPLPTAKGKAILSVLKINPNGAEVAREARVPYNTVYTLASNAGLKFGYKGGKRRISAETERAIVAALREEPNAAKVAQTFGIAKSTVLKFGNAAGIRAVGKGGNRQARRYERLPEDVRDAVIAALRETPNAAIVAKRLEIPQPTVRKIAREKGLALKGRQAEAVKPASPPASSGRRSPQPS